MKSILGVRYADRDERQQIDFYLPDDSMNCGRAVIWLHGGGLVGGNARDNAFLAEALYARGIALCLPGYRLMPKAQYPDFLCDAAAAVKKCMAVLGEAGARARFLLGGSSAGAYLAMMLCFAREWLGREGLSPEDISAYLFDAGQPTAHFGVLSSRGLDERRIIVDETAPLYHVTDARPNRPIFLLCADDDIPSRATQNALLYETLLRFGADAEKTRMEILPGYRHCGYDSARDANGEYILVNRMLWLFDHVASENGGNCEGN